MTELLLRLFIKGDRDTTAGHSAIGKLAGIVGIVCNVLLFGCKFAVGFIAGSVAIMADAVNNLLDASSSVVTFLGFYMAQRPADKGHPFGHARYEYLAGLVVAGIILISGGDQARTALEHILRPAAPNLSAASFIVLSIAICVKLWMCFFFRRLGSRTGSTSLKATAIDCRNDVITSASVLLGCTIEYLWGIRLDGYVAMAVALFILYSGIRLTGETVSPLLGKQADDELIQQITQLVLSHDKVLGIHDLLIHDYGPGQCYASVHAEISALETPIDAHEIIDHIEKETLERMNVHLVIHFDPVLPDDVTEK